MVFSPKIHALRTRGPLSCSNDHGSPFGTAAKIMHPVGYCSPTVAPSPARLVLVEVRRGASWSRPAPSWSCRAEKIISGPRQTTTQPLRGKIKVLRRSVLVRLGRVLLRRGTVVLSCANKNEVWKQDGPRPSCCDSKSMGFRGPSWSVLVRLGRVVLRRAPSRWRRAQLC